MASLCTTAMQGEGKAGGVGPRVTATHSHLSMQPHKQLANDGIRAALDLGGEAFDSLEGSNVYNKRLGHGVAQHTPSALLSVGGSEGEPAGANVFISATCECVSHEWLPSTVPVSECVVNSVVAHTNSVTGVDEAPIRVG